MKNNLMIKISIAVFILCAFSIAAVAQSGSGISKADQQKIINIFKDVPSSEYKLVFDNGKKTVGGKQIKMTDLKRVSKNSSSRVAGVKWTFIVGDRSANEVFYIYTEGASKMASLLGQEKFQALQDLAAKYGDITVD